MSAILDEKVPNEKKKLAPLKSLVKFEDGAEKYGAKGCFIPISIMLFVIFLLIITPLENGISLIISRICFC
jgi:hypothetical protein